VIVMSVLVRATYPAQLVEAARNHPEPGQSESHDHGATTAPSRSLRQKLADPRTRILIAQNFAMDWGMLWKDLALGFLIAGALSVFIPDSFWQVLFVRDAPGWIKLPANALVGPLAAMISFVCSIGNVPMAAVLWGAGVSFGGVLAFLYADLIVIPLLDVYRRYYGWKMAAYIWAIFYAAMAISAMIIDAAFTALGWIPARNTDIRTEMTHFSVDYTFWLNIAAAAAALCLFRTARRNRMTGGHCERHGPAAHAHHHQARSNSL
jgi:uncharacterized membrane protein YraQ (UPF0718 family)